jgi:hypothetical protein
MEYEVRDSFGHLLGKTFISWGELYLLKQSVLISVSWKTVVLL